MHYLKLIQNLEKYSKITDSDKKSIKFSFNPLKVRQKEILISENEQCNKLFFVNKGLLLGRVDFLQVLIALERKA